MKTTRRLDIVAGIGIIALAAIIIWIAIPLGVQEPKKVKFVALSPSYYPRLVAYCLLAFGVLLTTTRLLIKTKTTSEEPAAQADHGSVSMLLWVSLTLLFYAIALPTLGFVVTSTIVLFVLLLLAGERKPVWLVFIPALLPVSLFFFFTKVANIPIPTGIFETMFTGG